MMKGEYKFVFGLANDEIGYIIPKSEWDEVPPYLYNHHTLSSKNPKFNQETIDRVNELWTIHD